jgi:hypothetical protein
VVDKPHICYALLGMSTYLLRLVLAPALFVGLSLAFQAEDLPETPYDESQEMACENTPVVLVQELQECVQSAEPVCFPVFGQQSCFAATGDQGEPGERLARTVLNPGVPIEAAAPLRC